MKSHIETELYSHFGKSRATILAMNGDGDMEYDLSATSVRICPACGVVNPAGPSDTCPHLQLVRFPHLSAELDELLGRMAAVRVQYRDTLAELKGFLNHAAKNGEAEVMAAHKVNRISDVEALQRQASPWSLTHPKLEEKRPRPAPKRKQRKPPAPESVDPRQLALLIRETPKGDA